MAERIKDKEDLALEAMFRSDRVPDDGFSARVVSRVRRRIWLRRLTLPFAVMLGLAISAKPMLQFARAVPDLLHSVFGSTPLMERLPYADILQPSTILFGASLVMAILLASRILEE
jgi:hypothetical protein